MTASSETHSSARVGPGRQGRSIAAPTASQPELADAAFERLFRSHYARVLAYVLRRLPERPAAEDITAETFLIAWRSREKVPADPLPWLLVVARNVIHNERRSARRRHDLTRRVAGEPAPRQTETDADQRSASDQERFLDALGRLKESDREVLMLTTWDGLDRSRAAVVLGCSEKTFAVRLHRARRRLASALAQTAEPKETEPR